MGGRTGLDTMAGAPINMRGDVLTKDKPTMTLQGTDLYATIPDLSVFDAHTVVIDKPITIGDFERLGITGRTFQRIKWLRITFRLIMETASTTAGGYALAIIRDPTDVQESSLPGYRRLIGNDNVQIAKAWENSTVHLPRRQDWLYTSDDTEARWYSPGKLVVMTDTKISTGPYNVPVGASIYAHWSVAFKDPTIEDRSATIEALASNAALQVQDASVARKLTKADVGGNYAVLAGVRSADTIPVLRASEIFGGAIDSGGQYWKFPQTSAIGILNGAPPGPGPDPPGPGPDPPAPGNRLAVSDLGVLNGFLSSIWSKSVPGGVCVFSKTAASILLKINNKNLLDTDLAPLGTELVPLPVFTSDSGGLKVNNLNSINTFMDNLTFTNTCLVNGVVTQAVTTVQGRDTDGTDYTAIGVGTNVAFTQDSYGYLDVNDLDALNAVFAQFASGEHCGLVGDPSSAAPALNETDLSIGDFLLFPQTTPLVAFTRVVPTARAVDPVVIDTQVVTGVQIIGDVAYCVDALGRRVTHADGNSFAPTLLFTSGTILTPWNPQVADAYPAVGNRVGRPRFRVSPEQTRWMAKRLDDAVAALTLREESGNM